LPGSLSRRIIVVCGVLCAAFVLLAGLLLDQSSQMRSSLRWVAHSSEVLKTANRSLDHVRAAESGLRGFVLTHDPAFAEMVAAEIVAARQGAIALTQLTLDNPSQSARATQIRALIDERTANLEKVAALARSGNFAAAQTLTATGRGRFLMALVDARVSDLVNEERTLSVSRMSAAEDRLAQIRSLVMFGTPLTILALMLACLTFIRRIRRPVDAMLAVMGQLGAGDRRAGRDRQRRGRHRSLPGQEMGGDPCSRLTPSPSPTAA